MVSVVPSRRELYRGVELVRASDNSHRVIAYGRDAGWLHASLGDRWHAWLRTPGGDKTHLGRFGQRDAVRAIARRATVLTRSTACYRSACYHSGSYRHSGGYRSGGLAGREAS